jgi:cyclomaltodextrinase / maltogenic alpha-amylase / neopullulanase
VSEDRRRVRFAHARRPLLTFVLVLVAATLIALGPSIVGTSSLAPTTTIEVASAAWPDDAVVYHVFLDRFEDGDPSLNVEQPSDYTDALTGWMGGDLAGLRARLGHIASLGANTIWLSPVSPGPYHHGYHPTDLLDVNPYFGDVELLAAVVEDAQQLGMRVVYDLVLNHTSDRHPWFIDAQEHCKASEYERWYRFTTCPDEYAAFAGLDELPQLDLDHPPVRAYVFDEVLPFWLDEIGVDGFRLDHVEGPSRDFWHAFRAELDERWPGTFLLGEIWASQAVIDSYGEVVDAATAFPLRDRLVAVFAQGGDVRAIARPVASSVAAEGAPRPATYLSSHDQPRFTHLAGGDTQRTVLAYAAILTMPGLPVIYYGDEVGLSQSEHHARYDDFQDRWFREPMPWDEDTWDRPMLERISALARLRTTTPALHSGEHLDVVAEGEVWVFERRAEDERILVVINTSESPIGFDLADLYAGGVDPEVTLRNLLADAVPGSLRTVIDGSLTVEVDALDVAVLRIEGPLSRTPAATGD